jgi:prepilin-type N-terminal cleavage/methylation domain-containing protein
MKAGFTLLELIIAIAIMLILSCSLTFFLSQTHMRKVAIDRYVSTHTRASVVLHQLEKDIMGARVPIENILARQKEKDTKKQDTQQVEKAVPAPPATEKAGKKEATVEPTAIAHVFYTDQKNGKLVMFTLITSNPLKVYWSNTVGAPKPAIARVVYHLNPDPEHEESYILTRQEGADLDLAAYDAKAAKPIRAYDVVDGIYACSLRFIFIEQPEEETKKQETAEHVQQKTAKVQERNKQADHLPKITEYTTWDWPQTENAKKEEERPDIPLPSAVVITLALWDAQYERKVEVTYTVPIFVVPSFDLEKTDSKQNGTQENVKATDETSKKGAEKPRLNSKAGMVGANRGTGGMQHVRGTMKL